MVWYWYGKQSSYLPLSTKVDTLQCKEKLTQIFLNCHFCKIQFIIKTLLLSHPPIATHTSLNHPLPFP